MVALFDSGVTEAILRSPEAARRRRSSQSPVTSVSLLSSSTSWLSDRAMPRLTVPTKPRFSGFSSKVMRLSCAACWRSQALSAGSGLASSMTIRRYALWQVADSTEARHRWVSASPWYTGTMMSTGWSGAAMGTAWGAARWRGVRPSSRSMRILACTRGRVARNTVEVSMVFRCCTSCAQSCRRRGGFQLPGGALLGERLVVFFQAGAAALRLAQSPLRVAGAALQRCDAVLQGADRGRKGQVVRRHGPAQFDVQDRPLRRAGGQRCGRNRQFEPRLLAGEQQQRGAAGCGHGGLPDDLVVHGGRQQAARAAVRVPLPHPIALRAAQSDAVQMQESGAIRRVQPQLREGLVLRGEHKAQGLAFCANGTGGGELAGLGVLA